MKSILLCILLLFAEEIYSAIIMQPYLMGVQTNSIWVLVECSTPDTVIVDYGTTPSYGNAARTSSISITTNATFVHKIYVNGLDENTQYFYRARQLSSVSGGYRFLTAVNEQTPFRFVWIGDFRTGTAVHDQICGLIPQYNPRFYLNGGDVAVTGSYTDFKNEFFRQGELNLISSIPFFLAAGNHESWDTNTKAFTKGITIQSGTEDYYSFDYGNMHVLVINNMVSYSQGSNQYNFAMADLGSTAKTWKIVISHYPAYCAGGHGEDPGMIAMTQNIFVPKGVDMVISGHSHFYQHNRVSGIEHMVLGGGGAPLYDPALASYTIKTVKDYNFGIIDVSTGSFFLKVYNNLNLMLDSVRLTKNFNGLNEHGSIINSFHMNEVFPNPSNPGFTVSFDIKDVSNYKLELFDITGKKLAVLKNGKLNAGHYEISLNTGNLSSGLYFVMLSDGKNFDSQKIAVVK
jgi:hypothetical protein